MPTHTNQNPLLQMHNLLQYTHPVTSIPYHSVYPILQCVPPITYYTPYYKVCPLLQCVPPIAKCNPYYNVYHQSQSCTCFHTWYVPYRHALLPCKFKLTCCVLVTGLSLVNSYTDNLLSEFSAHCCLL